MFWKSIAAVSDSDHAALVVLAAGLATAVVTDVRTRRIPNWLTGALAAAGFGMACGGGAVTPLQAALGLLAGLLLMMPGHVIGATGAGDVKLMAAVGAVVGPGWRCARSSSRRSPAASSRSSSPRAAAGSRHGLRHARSSSPRPAGAREAIEAPTRANRFAYGPAIAIGTLLSLMVTL